MVEKRDFAPSTVCDPCVTWVIESGSPASGKFFLVKIDVRGPVYPVSYIVYVVPVYVGSYQGRPLGDLCYTGSRVGSRLEVWILRWVFRDCFLCHRGEHLTGEKKDFAPMFFESSQREGRHCCNRAETGLVSTRAVTGSCARGSG
jgi:hypothetical protein